jgi:hypothetical protein
LRKRLWMGRNIAEVLSRCLAEVPDDFIGYEGLKKDFRSIVESAKYCAPELASTLWDRAAESLTVHLEDPTLGGFRTRVAAIFGDLE